MLGRRVRGAQGRLAIAGGLILSFALATRAAGEPPDTRIFSLESVVHEVVAWHPSVNEAVGRLNATAEEIEVAEAGYLPTISAGIGAGHDNISRSRWRPRANISASQMLYDFGKVSSSVASAEADTGVSRAQLLIAVDNLVRDANHAVIEIQRTAALHQVAVDQLETIRGISELVDHRHRRGAATRSDSLQAKARVQSAEATIEEIAAERQRWESNLAHLLGRHSAPRISPDMPDWFLRSCVRFQPDWPRVPAIMQVRAQRDQAMAELDRRRAEGLPTVSLAAGTSADIHEPFSRRVEYNFGINISSELFSGGANKARRRSAAFALGAADAAEARVRNEVSRLLGEARHQVDSFNEVLVTLSARQDSMGETGQLYRLQYLEMGTRTLVDLLNAEQEFHQVRFNLVNTRHDLRRLHADCLFNSGTQRDAFGLSGMLVHGVTL